MLVQAAIFAVASAGVVLLSRRSLGARRSHGFYRFFAFEFLLALILLNAPWWFDEPLSPRQLASWLLLAIALALAVESFRLLRRIGRPMREADREANLPFENTTALVTVGAYRFIRHPMYASLLALAWGAFLKHPSAAGAALAGAVTLFLTATAAAEERENLRTFGAAYAAYRKTTRRFIPFLI
jgi:protein-S-isoprenylcysteine O-methyltransferase Ste14